MNKNIYFTSGNIEFLKFIATCFMTMDHINKYLFNSLLPFFFEIGRIAMPIFIFVLAYNLAISKQYTKLINRLLFFAIISSPVFIALGGLYSNFYPLNIMFTLLVVTIVSYCIERKKIILACIILLIFGGIVEYWWPAVVLGVSIFCFFRFKNYTFLMFSIISLLALYFINNNLYALMVVPILCILLIVNVPFVRLRYFFYIYYPAHLLVIFIIKTKMMNAGYLFFY